MDKAIESARPRESGFYWVQKERNPEWIAAEWSRAYQIWWIPGIEEQYEDKHFDTINETRILNPDELGYHASNEAQLFAEWKDRSNWFFDVAHDQYKKSGGIDSNFNPLWFWATPTELYSKYQEEKHK